MTRGRKRIKWYLNNDKIDTFFAVHFEIGQRKRARLVRMYGLAQHMSDLAFKVMTNDILRNHDKGNAAKLRRTGD